MGVSVARLGGLLRAGEETLHEAEPGLEGGHDLPGVGEVVGHDVQVLVRAVKKLLLLLQLDVGRVHGGVYVFGGANALLELVVFFLFGQFCLH